MAAAGGPNLDLSLDDLIFTNNSKTRRRGGGRGGGRRGNNRANFGYGTVILGRGVGGFRASGRPARRVQAMPYTVPIGLNQSVDGSKIMVSNLHFNVTEADLKELFSTQVGPLRKVMLSYDQGGRSRGIAEIVFRNRDDSAIAYQRFNGVTLDGRPMQIEIILQPDQVRRNIVVGRPNNANGGRGSRSSGSGRGRGRRGRNNRPLKTVDMLDAEMTAYMAETMDKPNADEDIPM